MNLDQKSDSLNRLKMPLSGLLICLCLAAQLVAQSEGSSSRRQLLVISVDGMDYRYLRDADRLGLKIPNLRRLMREGEVTEGVTGVFRLSPGLRIRR